MLCIDHAAVGKNGLYDASMEIQEVYHCDKSMLVATNTVFVATKLCKYNFFIATRVLLRQTYFCRAKEVFCRDKHIFVATKMILVAAPANDSSLVTEGCIVSDDSSFVSW